jgi:hypothetical protein
MLFRNSSLTLVWQYSEHNKKWMPTENVYVKSKIHEHHKKIRLE